MTWGFFLFTLVIAGVVALSSPAPITEVLGCRLGSLLKYFDLVMNISSSISISLTSIILICSSFVSTIQYFIESSNLTYSFLFFLSLFYLLFFFFFSFFLVLLFLSLFPLLFLSSPTTAEEKAITEISMGPMGQRRSRGALSACAREAEAEATVGPRRAASPDVASWAYPQRRTGEPPPQRGGGGGASRHVRRAAARHGRLPDLLLDLASICSFGKQ